MTNCLQPLNGTTRIFRELLVVIVLDDTTMVKAMCWSHKVDREEMILAEIEKKGEENSREWYPGKYVGLPEPGRGEWLVIS